MRPGLRHSLVRREVAAGLGEERIPAEEAAHRAADPAGVGRMEAGPVVADRTEVVAMEPGILQPQVGERERRSNLLAEEEDSHSPAAGMDIGRAAEADIGLVAEDQAGRRRAAEDIEAVGSPGEHLAGVRRGEADRMRRGAVL